MRVPVVIPDLKHGSEPLVISGWLIDEGDLVVAGDLILELLIPGVSVDVFAEASGRLAQILKPMDSKVATGEIVAWLDDLQNTPTTPVVDMPA